MLAEALEQIDNADSNFPLARANSKCRAATWYAERRNQQRYGGHKVNINIGDSVPTMSEALGEDVSAILASLDKEE